VAANERALVARQLVLHQGTGEQVYAARQPASMMGRRTGLRGQR
jgi:hypothetical protein